MSSPNRSDTNRSVQAQKTARSLKFRILVEDELYYPSSENKGADQLRGYREADLRLCFRLCRLLVFPPGGSFIKRPDQRREFSPSLNPKSGPSLLGDSFMLGPSFNSKSQDLDYTYRTYTISVTRI